ncbi:MAG: MmgE/PrpD family protein [Firmicutes bacterium]|nr:MmgE/PrpD family protein [Bacillota bacterium]
MAARATIVDGLVDVAMAWAGGAIPPDVRRIAALHLLDALGVGIAASSLPEGQSVLAAVRALGTRSEATALGAAERLPAPSAALANGALIHALEYDDTHIGSVVHASSVVVPAALAAAELAGASGSACSDAIVLGWEVLIRLGLAAPGAFQRQGFQTTAACGPAAAALVAGWLLGLDRDRLAAAVGIGASLAGGVFEFLGDGSDVKVVYPGWAAHMGLVAAHLAREGVRGPATALEGRFGLYRTHAAGAEPDRRVFDDLGTVWHARELSYKAYPCCHYIHAFLDACAELRDGGVAAADVERVECTVPAEVVPVICEPWERKLRPASAVDARFSLPYAVASMWLDGAVDVDTFRPQGIRPEVLAFAARVTYRPEEGMGYPARFAGRVTCVARDGSRYTADVPAPSGSPDRPWQEADVRAKWRAAAGRRLPESVLAEVEAWVMRLERQRSVRALGRLLRSGLSEGRSR